MNKDQKIIINEITNLFNWRHDLNNLNTKYFPEEDNELIKIKSDTFYIELCSQIDKSNKIKKMIDSGKLILSEDIEDILEKYRQLIICISNK